MFPGHYLVKLGLNGILEKKFLSNQGNLDNQNMCLKPATYVLPLKMFKEHRERANLCINWAKNLRTNGQTTFFWQWHPLYMRVQWCTPLALALTPSCCDSRALQAFNWNGVSGNNLTMWQWNRNVHFAMLLSISKLDCKIRVGTAYTYSPHDVTQVRGLPLSTCAERGREV